MKPSKRDLWRDLEALEPETGEIHVTSEVVTLTDTEGDPVEVPEGATLLETESPVVTVWRGPEE